MTSLYGHALGGNHFLGTDQTIFALRHNVVVDADAVVDVDDHTKITRFFVCDHDHDHDYDHDYGHVRDC